MSWRTAPRLALLLALPWGCTGVPLRPDGTPGPEQCPAGALEAMREMGIKPGDKGKEGLGGLRKREGSVPGVAVVEDSLVILRAVDGYR